MPRRVTIRLTPFQARALSRLRTAGLPEGESPRSTTSVLIDALLKEARRVEASGAEAPAPAREAVESQASASP
jgi:hypothetical protein